MDLTAVQVRERLRLMMSTHDLDQKAISAAIGVSQQYVSDVLTGRREPAGKILEYLKLERVVFYRSTERKVAARRA
jgi:transcriptional regulator with XRE-family HTH domain